MSSKAHTSALSPTFPSQRSSGAETRLPEGMECGVGQPPAGHREPQASLPSLPSCSLSWVR